MDAHALAQIHDRYYPEVYRYVRFRLDDDQVCEDIAAEVFLRLLDALNKRGGPEKNLRGWLLGTSSNLVNDHLRKIYRRPTDDLDSKEDLPSLGDSPEASYFAAWELNYVRKAVEQLTLEQQHVLALRFADDISLEETAKTIGKSVAAVKALQFRALASLKRLLSVEEREQP
jgi:RNA polymerase sigma-70 factor (ECF subfamily)